MLIFLLSVFFMLLFVLLAVAFFTLLERKGLSYSQSRVGPDKVGWGGILQPLMDGLKLILKGPSGPVQTSYFYIYLFPAIFFLLMLQVWLAFCSTYCFSGGLWGLFFFLCVSGVASVMILMIGITSFSKFSILGGMRAVAQGVSYEIVFSILVFCLGCMGASSGFFSLYLSQTFLLFIFFFICLTAEANRAPFDFAEGESELISGFNIEYGGGAFIFIFLGEYGFILGMCFLTSILFFDIVFIVTPLMFFLIIMMRGLFPRFRYDALMGLCWLILLPLSIFFSFLFPFLML